MRHYAIEQAPPRQQAGSSLIEVLVAILILSFGVLALAAMTASAVQLPRSAGLRASASNLANDLIERMRANVPAYVAGSYDTALTYDGNLSIPTVSSGCAWPGCTSGQLASMDLSFMAAAVRSQLPAGGFSVVNEGTGKGEVFILWQEASGPAAPTLANSDICPAAAATFIDPKPRCLVVPFTL